CDAAPTAADVPALRQRIVDLKAAPVAARPPTTPTPQPVIIPQGPPPSPGYVVVPEPEVVATPRRRARPTDGEEELRAPNSIYAEGLGAALLYSINYERLIIDDLAARVGFSYFPLSAGGVSSTSLFFPITLSYIGLHSGKHALELGGGVTLLY